MGDVWEHTELGRLELRGGLWEGIAHVPAFDAFSYVPRRGHFANGRYELAIDMAEGGGPPPEEAVAIAVRLLAAPEETVQMIVRGL